MNWLRRNAVGLSAGIGLVLLALNWAITLAPGSTTPIRYGPAIFATVLAVLLVSQAVILQDRVPHFAPAHLTELKEISLQVRGRSMTDDPFLVTEARERLMLTAHFPIIATLLRKSEKLRAEDHAAREAVKRRATDTESSLGLAGDGAFAKLLHQVAWQRATGGGLNARFVADWKPQGGSIKVKSPETQQLMDMATYQNDAERDLLVHSLNTALDETSRWKETKHWNKVFEELRKTRNELSAALSAVVYMQVLRNYCDYCRP
jgi:hypothetical protein